ncbi:RICIN domain-containing protein [Parafilimonas sp.]|uniref:RICIN domain-containing protein n=1 Tax=Parafilimonas sp. TaxID=1969739 RepID=UPI0039E27C1D
MKKLFSCIFFITVITACSKNVNDSSGDDDIDTPETMAASDTVTSSTVNFKGVNWADLEDNFADGWLMLSGLSVSDDEATVTSKAETILSAFKSNDANTVRLPVNPSTVLQDWWPKHAAVISQAASMGMKVILAYWEGASSKDGLVDNETAFWLMWDRVVAKYSGNQNVYFEVMNEPYSYSLANLESLYTTWLEKYPGVPKHRILLDGAGYATDVNSIGADSRFDSCLLSFHFYTWFNGDYETTADWELPVKSLAYPNRTVMTEFGTTMTSGNAFTSAPGNNNEVTYLQGITSQLHDLGVGSVYWPGLRTDDTYSMFAYDGSTLTANNESGLERLQYGWGSGTANAFYADFAAGAFYKVINRNSSKALDVNSSSTANGGNIIQWDYSGGDNQQWSFNTLSDGFFSIINKNSSKALDVNDASADAGASIVQWDYSGGASQQWQITDIGFGYYKIINKNSGQALDVNGGSTSNGGDIIQWYWNNGFNQQWLITTP